MPKISVLKCGECGASFEAKRSDAKYCPGCRKRVYTRQTSEKRKKNWPDYLKKNRERVREHARANRDAIRQKLRERYATDAEYRERRKQLAREWSAIHGNSHSTAERRKRYAEGKYARNKDEHNRRRHERWKANRYRQDACAVCGLDDERILTVHHKIPLEKGGSSEPENLETLCANCHKIADWEARYGHVFDS